MSDSTLNIKKRKSSSVNKLPLGFICICILPAVFFVLLFTIYPAYQALSLSMTNTGSIALGRGEFIGFGNYLQMFNNRVFWEAFSNTMWLIAIVPAITIFLSVVFAFVLTQSKLREKGIYRVLFFLPSVLSLVVVAVVWAALLGPRAISPINSVLGFFGIEPLMWLGDPNVALGAIMIVLIWQAVGYYMILLVSSIDSINKEVFEAADIDGASGTIKLFRITFPLVKDNIGIAYVLSAAGTMVISFVLANVMTGGGPGNATLVLLGHVINSMFAGIAFGYAMAVAVFTLAISILLAVVVRVLTYRSESS